MADVARAAGVSQQTVSRVANGLPNVNEQTRQRVQAAMQELGFRPSYAGRSLRDGRYHSVGLCVNDVTKFGNLSMIDGIASAAREHNCAITLVEMSKTEEFSLAEATRRMAALPVDGIIIVASPQDLVGMVVEKAVKMAEMMNVPIVGLVENMSYVACPDCGKKIYLFGEGKSEEAAKRHNLPLLAQMPIDPKLAALVDAGKIEEFEGTWLNAAADALEKTRKRAE